MVSIFHGSLALLTWDNQIQTDMSSRVYPYITPGPSGGAVPPKWKIPCAAAKASILPPWASLGLHIKRLWVNALFCLVWLLIITPKVVCDWQRFKQAKVTKFSYPKTLGGYKTLARPGAVGCRHPDRVRLAPCTDCRTPVALAGGAPIAECHPGPDRTAVRYLLASLSKNRLIVEDSYTRGWPRPITHSRGFWTRPNTVLFVRYLLTLQIAPPLSRVDCVYKGGELVFGSIPRTQVKLLLPGGLRVAGWVHPSNGNWEGFVWIENTYGIIIDPRWWLEVYNSRLITRFIN